MFVSMRWLARHVSLDGITPEQLCNDLTLSTAEVEGLERFAPQLHDVVVGNVVEKNAHPDAEKLSICRVDVGEQDALTIVCGAPNVESGQKVAVACIGTTLPFDFKIKKSKIRGVESRGMICSVRELDLGEEHDGIWVLPENASVGAPVAEALGIDDWIIEIDNKSLTHRPDLWGHRGIAREIAAIYERELLPIDTALPKCGSAVATPVSIETKGCPRYIALQIDGVSKSTTQESPDWLRWLLLAVGQRPIDLLVDLSNFVMLDLGQPNHVFDRRQLNSESAKADAIDRSIVVRNARDEEIIITLDGEERKLRSTDLLICAGDTAVALAGIMGGELSKVAEETDSLLLEVATFDAATVRRTSTRVGLRSDASARFEKTLDPTLPLLAAGHFANLLSAIDPHASYPAPLTDEGVWKDPTSEIELRCERVRTALGKALSNEEIRGILERLAFRVETLGDDQKGLFRIFVPSFRASKDITIEQDLIEEVGRIYRYGNIPERALTSDIVPPPRDERRKLVRHLQDRLSGGARFHENLSYSFIDDALLEKMGELDRPHVSVINPVVQGEAKIRRSVAPSLLSALEANRRNRGDVRLFELGKGYEPEHVSERGEPRERHFLAMVWAGPPPGKKAPYDESRMMGLQAIVEDLIRSRGRAVPAWTADGNRPAWAHPGKCLFLRSEADCDAFAVVAELEPGLAPAIGLDGDLKSEVAIAEICLDALLEAKPDAEGYKPLPRFPGIKVDVAVAIDEAVPAGEVLALIEQAGKKQVAQIELFDLYRGKSVGTGRKSLAFHVLLQSDTKTLTDKEEQKFLKRFERLVTEAGFELRGR
ncbi:MAG TPA: phenylalanine--tRNA ligase subunit beta [Myxococcales bacterium]|nr:phenylalanine--tRNA ligase subunit beta [Myxococcales bacterium]HIK86244.1 phenylalanine--tRNA ligase subunit beta [Myxococcales bacterium]